MNNIGRIIELLTILTSTLEPSRGFETLESEFEQHQQTKHRALGRASPPAGRTGHPSSIEDKALPGRHPHAFATLLPLLALLQSPAGGI
jgi:hypothetical protein